jgi:hypothetical protein
MFIQINRSIESLTTSSCTSKRRSEGVHTEAKEEVLDPAEVIVTAEVLLPYVSYIISTSFSTTGISLNRWIGTTTGGGEGRRGEACCPPWGGGSHTPSASRFICSDVSSSSRAADTCTKIRSAAATAKQSNAVRTTDWDPMHEEGGSGGSLCGVRKK